jgi:hypothetical protein
VSPFAPGVLAFSRILNNREVLVVANANTKGDFQGHVLVDSSINHAGEQYRVLNNSKSQDQIGFLPHGHRHRLIRGHAPM